MHVTLYMRELRKPPRDLHLTLYANNRLIRVTRVDNWLGGVTPWFFLRNPDVANRADLWKRESDT